MLQEWTLGVKLTYLWQSGVTAGFPGILQHKTSLYDFSDRDNYLLLTHWVPPTTALSSLTQTLMYDATMMCVCVSVWVEISDHVWITWDQTKLLCNAINKKKAEYKMHQMCGTLVKTSHSERLKSCDSKITQTYKQKWPYKQKCCLTRIWLRSCSASCRNCSSSLIVPPCCVQAALRFKYWSSRGGGTTHAPAQTRTHTPSTSWHLQERDAEILWVHKLGSRWYKTHWHPVTRMKKREVLREKGGVA